MYVNERCRCEPCTAANREAENRRNRLSAYGRWEPYVDAEPAREHSRFLMRRGMEIAHIAQLSGQAYSTVDHLLNGRPAQQRPPTLRLRPATSTAILAVPADLDLIRGATKMDATGTRRRLQALVRRGWPLARLARELGMHPANFGPMMRSSRVRADTARAVRRLYDRLWNADPADHGVEQRNISRATNHALARGWVPAAAWDDDTIDAPDADFDLGALVPRHLALAEDADWLAEEHGYSRRHAADRLGVAKNTLDQSITRARRDQAVTV
ncbi:hypothetical protein AB0E82_21405 [Streptomyces anulatus]|uniref:hypothetical protein n=1 Tax=Streptomyces anulatus TaxID=1892 RepID=UPI0033C850E4